jgi:hypothetical protein
MGFPTIAQPAQLLRTQEVQLLQRSFSGEVTRGIYRGSRRRRSGKFDAMDQDRRKNISLILGAFRILFPLPLVAANICEDRRVLPAEKFIVKRHVHQVGTDVHSC